MGTPVEYKGNHAAAGGYVRAAPGRGCAARYHPGMPDPVRPASPPEPTPPRQATLLQVMGAVFWSFFGVRKGKAMRDDEASINPAHVIIVGVIFAAIFVFTLLFVVRIITRGI